MAELVQNPYPVFKDIDGTALEDGFIFIGVSGADPEVSPQQAYWDLALTVPANNIRTKSGYPFNGTFPSRLYTAGPYSIKVKNKREVIIYAQQDSVVSASSTNITWTAGTTAGPICNSSTGTDEAIPSASGSASGAITTGAQTLAGVKTFNAIPVVPDNPVADSNTGVVTGNNVFNYAEPLHFTTVTTIADGVDVSIEVPDAATNVAERTYIRKGAGTGKLILTSAGGNFDYGDDTASTVEIEGIGQAIIQPQGGLQYVRGYEDYLTDTDQKIWKTKEGTEKQIIKDSITVAVDAASGTLFRSATNTGTTRFHTFTSVDEDNLSILDSANALIWITSESTAIQATKVKDYFLVSNGTNTSATYSIISKATGRWRT